MVKLFFSPCQRTILAWSCRFLAANPTLHVPRGGVRSGTIKMTDIGVGLDAPAYASLADWLEKGMGSFALAKVDVERLQNAVRWAGHMRMVCHLPGEAGKGAGEIANFLRVHLGLLLESPLKQARAAQTPLDFTRYNDPDFAYGEL